VRSGRGRRQHHPQRFTPPGPIDVASTRAILTLAEPTLVDGKVVTEDLDPIGWREALTRQVVDVRRGTTTTVPSGSWWTTTLTP
jgi:hypothetical protein